jgi:hypothetical protein
MAPPNKPVVGELYSLREQYEMHGGNMQRCAPDKDGRVLLLRVKPDLNPDAPGIIDWEAPNDPWVKTIQEQTQQKPLPVYVRRRPNEWEHMGQFCVARVATDGPTLAERRERTGLQVSYAIHLERS